MPVNNLPAYSQICRRTRQIPVSTVKARSVVMKDAAKCLRRFEVSSVAPAIGRFAAFANAFARPAAFKRLLAFQAVARLGFINALGFWFHCWFGHKHTLAYGKYFVKDFVTFVTNLLNVSRITASSRQYRTPKRKIVFCGRFAGLFLISFFGISAANSADLARGLSAVNKGDYETALKEWLPLAEEGDPSAQYNVGQLYRLGRGVKRDYAKAGQWYEKAAEQWHSAARHNLAVLYEKGLGVPINYTKAFEWYEKAANQDYGVAQFNLAVMYSIGQGTKRDLVKAYMWYAIAADRGYDDAAENLDLVARQMSKTQLDEAREEARDWLEWRKKE